MPPFHVYSPFPTSDPRSYPIHEVSQFEYNGLILDPKLTMHLATVEAIRNRMQIKTVKTKIMALIETPALLRARGGSTPAQPNHASRSRVLALSNLRPPLVPYPRSLPI